ncbi:hypothetical protein C8J56DRAFT_286144 [Mycena floridula]|nr:hypothetical protein C8J56DRAFT_286144 [Mycena floridula]
MRFQNIFIHIFGRTADIEQHYRRTGEFIMKNSLPVIVETSFWTLYVVTVVLSVYVLWQKGLNRARIALLALIGMMFVLDTVAFSLDLYTFFYQTREIFLSGMFDGDGLDSVLIRMDTIYLVRGILDVSMLILGDCIVIWRAYAVWTRYRIIMVIPVLFLLGWIVNFPFLVACYVKHKDDDSVSAFGPTACLATSASALILSFCANVSATLMIFYMAWTYYVPQRKLRTSTVPLRRSSQVARVLLLLVESGFAYFLLMILSIAINLVPIPDYGVRFIVEQVLGYILTPHCVAMVPTLTILLITLYGSFEDYSVGNISQPMHFATPRVTQLTEESILSPPGQLESDAEANGSHSSNTGQEREIKVEK